MISADIKNNIKSKMVKHRKIGFLSGAFSKFKVVAVLMLPLLLPSSAWAQFFESEKPVPYRVGFEGNTSVYRWANGYREQLVPTFNTTREARRSVVSGGLFSIVSFDNVPCNSDSLEVGTCYSNRECTNMGGTSSGICAGSYGTCCVLRQTCGGTITTNNTYFVNPSYPGTDTGPLSCTITINKLASASQLYIEFLDFDLRDASSGACMNDTFTAITPDNSVKLPTLCGNLTGQSVYLPIGDGPATLSFNLAASVSRADDDARSWKLRIVQFNPTDACAAPPGCQQYYREPTGVFQSLNFNNGLGVGELINNLNYNVCFATSSLNCGVILSEGTFMLPGTSPDCSEGFYLLLGGLKYCGDTLNNGMIIANQTGTSLIGSGYALVQVVTGASNPDMDQGFSLNYSPFPCAMSG